jgi:LacI family transcriptional regulator
MKNNIEKSITEVARECGVSAMTVSRALRGNSLVKESTRQTIVGVAERLGYIRSPRIGRPVVTGNEPVLKVQLIAGTMGRSMAVFHSRLLTSIEQQLSRNSYECVVRTCDGKYQQFLRLLENVRNSDAAGTMIVGSFVTEQLKALLETSPGAILLDNPGEPSIEIPYGSFAFDNSEAARIAVRHLADCGRRKILLVNGAPKHFFTREIEQGYREALICRNIKVNEKLILHTDFTADNAYEAMVSALNADLRFDAVFTNDEMASGVYRALLERGLKIPQDVAVCGCDGLPVGTHLYPRLTTVVLDYEELGKMAIKHVLEAGSDCRIPCRVRLLPSLEIRESTVCS